MKDKQIANEEDDADETGEDERLVKKKSRVRTKKTTSTRTDDEDPNAAALNEAQLICQRR